MSVCSSVCLHSMWFLRYAIGQTDTLILRCTHTEVEVLSLYINKNNIRQTQTLRKEKEREKRQKNG